MSRGGAGAEKNYPLETGKACMHEYTHMHTINNRAQAPHFRHFHGSASSNCADSHERPVAMPSPVVATDSCTLYL